MPDKAGHGAEIALGDSALVDGTVWLVLTLFLGGISAMKRNTVGLGQESGPLEWWRE